MKGNLRPILWGFGIATIGATASALYILGLTRLYLGGALHGILYLAGAGALYLLFRACLRRYFDALEEGMPEVKENLLSNNQH